MPRAYALHASCWHACRPKYMQDMDFQVFLCMPSGVGVPDDSDAVRLAGREGCHRGHNARNLHRHSAAGGRRVGAQRGVQVPPERGNRLHLEGRRPAAAPGQPGALTHLSTWCTTLSWHCGTGPVLTEKQGLLLTRWRVGSDSGGIMRDKLRMPCKKAQTPTGWCPHS